MFTKSMSLTSSSILYTFGMFNLKILLIYKSDILLKNKFIIICWGLHQARPKALERAQTQAKLGGGIDTCPKKEKSKYHVMGQLAKLENIYESWNNQALTWHPETLRATTILTPLALHVTTC